MWNLGLLKGEALIGPINPFAEVFAGLFISGRRRRKDGEEQVGDQIRSTSDACLAKARCGRTRLYNGTTECPRDRGARASLAERFGQRGLEPKDKAILVTKQASSSAKIDPLMAAFNAIAPMATNPWSA
jgi:hypothetical protein